MKASRLPSGSYRVQFRMNGKVVSVTRATKRDAELEAAKMKANNTYSVSNITLERAMREYIESRASVLAPSTLREYKRAFEKDYEEIKHIPINNITQGIVQSFINNHAKTKSPKSCRNIHGLLSSVLKMYRPDFVLNTTLPQKDVIEEYIPTNEDIKVLMTIDDEELLDAICLAAFGPMRRSEICALRSDDIQGNIIHVQRALVWNGSEWVIKKTKTIAGDRYIEFPSFVIDRFKGREGNLFSLKPNNISNRFHKKLPKIGLKSFRFHSLRHFASSYFHYLGLPDKAIQNRAGWESEYTMKKVYRHVLQEEQRKYDSLANSQIEKDFS